MAPELSDDKRTYTATDKVDIYSMGILINEVLSLREPYMEIENFFTIFDRIVKGEVRPKLLLESSRARVLIEEVSVMPSRWPIRFHLMIFFCVVVLGAEPLSPSNDRRAPFTSDAAKRG